MGCPSKEALPSVGGNNPVSIFMVVDLPQPLEPRKPKISPLNTSRLTSSTAVKLPNLLVKPSEAMTTSSLGGSGGLCTSRWARGFSAGKRRKNADSRLCAPVRSEEHTSELQSRGHLVCRILLE